MTIKAHNLQGAALNWAVALCERLVTGDAYDVGFVDEAGYNPSTDWSQGGPIIDRERISVYISFRGSYSEGANAEPTCWVAYRYQYGVLTEPRYDGPTPLIAAMRCYVASKLGEKIEVPEELIQ